MYLPQTSTHMECVTRLDCYKYSAAPFSPQRLPGDTVRTVPVRGYRADRAGGDTVGSHRPARPPRLPARRWASPARTRSIGRAAAPLPSPPGSRSLMLRLLVRFCLPRCGRARLRVSVGLSCGLVVPSPCCALSSGLAGTAHGGVRGKARPAPHLVHHDRHVIAVDLEQHGADTVLREFELLECVHHLSTRSMHKHAARMPV